MFLQERLFEGNWRFRYSWRFGIIVQILILISFINKEQLAQQFWEPDLHLYIAAERYARLKEKKSSETESTI